MRVFTHARDSSGEVDEYLANALLYSMDDEPQIFEKRGAAVTGLSSVSATLTVERGLNDIRLAVLGIIVTIGLTVGLGVDGTWWVQLMSGGGSFLLSAVLLHWGRSRHWLMTVAHWLTGH